MCVPQNLGSILPCCVLRVDVGARRKKHLHRLDVIVRACAHKRGPPVHRARRVIDRRVQLRSAVDEALSEQGVAEFTSLVQRRRATVLHGGTRTIRAELNELREREREG